MSAAVVLILTCWSVSQLQPGGNGVEYASASWTRRFCSTVSESFLRRQISQVSLDLNCLVSLNALSCFAFFINLHFQSAAMKFHF